MNNIGLILKKLRLESKLSWNEITTQMKDTHNIDIAQNTIYGYENNHRMPNADVFLALCQIYNCDDLFFEFGLTEKPNHLIYSKDEKQIIENYRNLEDTNKTFIKKALDVNWLNVFTRIGYIIYTKTEI